MINDQGGINGRKVNLISIDDAYSPAKTVDQTRKLVEQEEVAAILNPLGTPTGLAVRKYRNNKKVPQLFVGGMRSRSRRRRRSARSARSGGSRTCSFSRRLRPRSPRC